MEKQTKNLWDKDKRTLFRELYHQYLDEGYTQKEAKKLASEEADDMYGEAIDFAFEVADAEHDYD